MTFRVGAIWYRRDIASRLASLARPYSDEFRRHLTRPEVYRCRSDGAIERAGTDTMTDTTKGNHHDRATSQTKG